MHGIKLLMLMARYIIEHVGPLVRVQLLYYSGTAGNSTGRGNALLHVAVTGIMQPEIHGDIKKYIKFHCRCISGRNTFTAKCPAFYISGCLIHKAGSRVITEASFPLYPC